MRHKRQAPLNKAAALSARDERKGDGLRQDAAQLRAAMESAADGFWVIDGEGRLLDVNQAYISRSGYRREELLQMRIADLEVPDDPGEVAGRLEQARQARTLRYEVRHRTRGGAFWLVEVDLVHWPLAGGRFFVFSRDISQRRRSEALLSSRLKLSELSFRAGIGGLLQATLDEAERFTDSCLGFFHFVDADQENLTLQEWSTNTMKNMCTAEGQGRHYAISQAGVWVDCFRTKAPVIHNDYASLPHRKGMPAGHAPVVRELVVPVLRGGLVVALLGVGNKPSDYDAADVEIVQSLASMTMDLVARKRAEEMFRKAAGEWQTTFDAVGSAVWLLDAECRIVRSNLAAEKLFQRSAGQMLGRRCWEVAHGASEPPAECPIHALRRTGRRETAVLPVGPSWWEIVVDPIKDAAGQATGFVHIVTDVTGRKQLEAERECLYSQAQQEARIRAELLEEVNHRIKNNLTSILGLIQIARSRIAQDLSEAPNALGMLQGRLEGMLSVHNLLTLSGWQPVPLGGLASQIVEGAIAGSPIHGRIRLELVFNPGSGRDRRISTRQAVAVGLVLNELAINTIKHGFSGREQGRIHLEISLVPAGDAFETITLNYGDDGIGWPEDVLAGRRTGMGMQLIQCTLKSLPQASLVLADAGGAQTIISFKLPSPTLE